MATFKATQKLTPFLWFNGNLEEALKFYTSVFKNSESEVSSLTDPGNGRKMTVGTFRIEDQQFLALDGGPMFKFSPATSFYINCKDQEEIDYLWEALPAGGGKTSQCGWLDDKFGVTWQIVPEVMSELLYNNENPEKAKRVMAAMMQMTKMDIKLLQEAYDND
ncbi:VOC family protein [Mucilaginibacter sp. SMC90]|uniref:VOC family protein n=1 Tax=Mucilaginibacter sp. SMC90 TaxID=2929803 RepID=UPI001FB5006A|nr:VOC family protein [Mucilaginibacter sp. SMC90]UOE52333.1 VOC family protein [Mucilaginibacter sp. SMC90]